MPDSIPDSGTTSSGNSDGRPTSDVLDKTNLSNPVILLLLCILFGQVYTLGATICLNTNDIMRTDCNCLKAMVPRNDDGNASSSRSGGSSGGVSPGSSSGSSLVRGAPTSLESITRSSVGTAVNSRNTGISATTTVGGSTIIGGEGSTIVVGGKNSRGRNTRTVNRASRAQRNPTVRNPTVRNTPVGEESNGLSHRQIIATEEDDDDEGNFIGDQRNSGESVEDTNKISNNSNDEITNQNVVPITTTSSSTTLPITTTTSNDLPFSNVVFPMLQQYSEEYGGGGLLAIILGLGKNYGFVDEILRKLPQLSAYVVDPYIHLIDKQYREYCERYNIPNLSDQDNQMLYEEAQNYLMSRHSNRFNLIRDFSTGFRFLYIESMGGIVQKQGGKKPFIVSDLGSARNTLNFLFLDHNPGKVGEELEDWSPLIVSGIGIIGGSGWNQGAKEGVEKFCSTPQNCKQIQLLEDGKWFIIKG